MTTRTIPGRAQRRSRGGNWLFPAAAAAVLLAGPVAEAAAQHRLNGRSQNPRLQSRRLGWTAPQGAHLKPTHRPACKTDHGHHRGIHLFHKRLLTQARFLSSGVRVRWADGYIYPYDDYPPIVGVERRIDPNLVLPGPGGLDEHVEEPAEDPPPAGISLMRAGEYDAAAEAFAAERRAAEEDQARDQEASPTDPWERLDSLRWQAVALAAGGKVDQAAGMLLDLYRDTPYLAAMPLPGDQAFRSAMALRRVVVRAVRAAHREQSPRAWLLVAVLMQAEGREEVAAKMLGRAAALGLEADIVSAWPDVDTSASAPASGA